MQGSHGEWLTLLRDASRTLGQSTGPRSPALHADVERRVARAEVLVRLGERSAASRSLTAEPLVTGDEIEVLAHASAEAYLPLQRRAQPPPRSGGQASPLHFGGRPPLQRLHNLAWVATRCL